MFELYLQKIYALWAKLYDTVIDPWFKFDRAKVVRSLKVAKKDRILEIGVGTGLNLIHYPQGCSVVGIDISPAMLKKAKEKRSAAKVTLQVTDARKLPFVDNTFDKAVATYVVRVSPEPKKVMEEVARVVRKNGLFVVVDQFKGKNKVLLALLQPLKIVLGWGKEHDLYDLIADRPWIVAGNRQFGIMKNTRLVTLKNKKKSF